MRSTSLYRDTKHVNGFTSATISTNATTGGASIDMTQSPGGDWRYCLWLITVGTRTDGTYTPIVQDCDDNTTWVTADADCVQGPSVASIATSSATAEIGYSGRKRYCRLAIVSTGVTTGLTAVSARAILGGSATYDR